MNNLSTLTLAQLKKAVSLREKIELLQSELNSLLGQGGGRPSAPKPKRRKMSAAGRAAMAKAAKARWAKVKAAGRNRL